MLALQKAELVLSTLFESLLFTRELSGSHYSDNLSPCPMPKAQSPITNYQITMNNYLPLAYLNAWEYCPRRFYLEYQLGEMADNEHIIIGRHLHRNINEEGTCIEGDTTIYRQQWVWSHNLLIKGLSTLLNRMNG